MRSQHRAMLNAHRMITLAIFTFFTVLVLAYLAQVQIATNKEQIRVSTMALHQMCLEREANVKRANDSWDLLAEIEKRNLSVGNDVRYARLKVYREAQLTLPDCSG